MSSPPLPKGTIWWIKQYFLSSFGSLVTFHLDLITSISICCFPASSRDFLRKGGWMGNQTSTLRNEWELVPCTKKFIGTSNLELTKFPGKVFKSSAFNSRAAAGYTSLSLVESNTRKQREWLPYHWELHYKTSLHVDMLRTYQTWIVHRSELTNMANIIFPYALKLLWPNDRSLYRSVSNSCSGAATIWPLQHLGTLRVARPRATKRGEN